MSGICRFRLLLLCFGLFRSVMTVSSSVILLCLLLRLYRKQMGGVATDQLFARTSSCGAQDPIGRLRSLDNPLRSAAAKAAASGLRVNCLLACCRNVETVYTMDVASSELKEEKRATGGGGRWCL